MTTRHAPLQFAGMATACRTRRRVDAAVLIRDALLRTPVRTIAFVNKRAISAGALIALATTTIAMAEGGTLGAATPVAMGAPGGAAQPVEEKTVSYMRKEFRPTAEARRRPPLIAEAMVDADVEVPGLSDKGKLLTQTATPRHPARRHRTRQRAICHPICFSRSSFSP
jgi:Serine dehydrogenase proteinase